MIENVLEILTQIGHENILKCHKCDWLGDKNEFKSCHTNSSRLYCSKCHLESKSDLCNPTECKIIDDESDSDSDYESDYKPSEDSDDGEYYEYKNDPIQNATLFQNNIQNADSVHSFLNENLDCETDSDEDQQFT